jgi:hypothetical protein
MSRSTSEEMAAGRVARYCEHCDRSVPVENYLPKKGMCVECRAKLPDEKVAAAKMQQAKQFFGELLEATERPQTAGIKLEAVLDSLYDRFGGIEGFVNSMYAQIQIALVDHAGKSFVLKFFIDVLRLTNASNRLQHDREVTDLTDDQLKRELKLEAMRLISGDPKFSMMLTALQAAGVNVGVPPVITDGMSVTEFTEKIEANVGV